MTIALPRRQMSSPLRSIAAALPRGPRDLVRQIVIVSLFDIAYEASRVLAAGDRGTAMAHARSVVGAERSLGMFHELSVQHFAMHSPGIVLDIANWTYFNAQFTVTFGFLLWAYLFRTARYAAVRNTIIVADLLGLIGYLVYPTAPPRMLPGMGFVDALNSTAVNQHSGVISALANPYAAMPSLHTAYAVTFGVWGVVLTRRWWTRALWALYPGLVVFSIVATANHFLLDAVAGALVATVALAAARLAARKRPAVRPASVARIEPCPSCEPLARAA
jgi:membrane-associated phospholipid phosphatase